MTEVQLLCALCLIGECVHASEKHEQHVFPAVAVYGSNSMCADCLGVSDVLK